MGQNIIVALIVLACLVFIGMTVRKKIKSKSCGCGCCREHGGREESVGHKEQ